MNKIVLLLITTTLFTFAQTTDQSSIEINLDGLVNESTWSSAKQFSDFRQFSPGLDVPSTEKTSAFITNDKEYLYIAFVMQAKEVFGSIVERDVRFFLDDHVSVYIDTYNDKSNALVFSVNPLSARNDWELIDNGYRSNTAWNTYWDAKAAKTSNGWSCEFRIPFSSLRFEQSENVTMSFRFERIIKHTNEWVAFPVLSTSLDNLERNMFNSVSITFTNISSQTPIYFTPYVAGRVTQNSILNSDGTEYINETTVFDGKEYFDNTTTDKILSAIGFDIKYKLDNSNTLDLTMNTDFAQAESDAQVFNLTRYSIFYPEKRQFFLENADLFSANLFSHRMFHSRRIGIEEGYNVPILGGPRMTGVFQGVQYGLMNMQTNGLASKDIEPKNFSVFRIRKSLKQDDSYLGGIFTNKISTESSDYNREVGLDGIYRLSNSITTSFFGSATFDSQTGNKSNAAYGIGFSKLYQPEGLEFDVSLLNYEQNFNPEMGFLSVPNSIQNKTRVGWGFILPDDFFISRILVGSYNLHYLVSSTKELLYHQSNLYWWFIFRNGALFQFFVPWYQEDKLDEPWNFSESTTIPEGKYKSWLYEFSYQSGTINNYNWFADIVFGDFYDGKQVNFWSGINYIFSEKVRMSGEISYYNIKFPSSFSQKENATEEGVILKYWLTYNFAPDLSLNLFSQYNNTLKKIGSNIRLRYNPVEGTDLYIVYNSTLNTEINRLNPRLDLIDQQTFIIKFSKSFIL